MVKKLQALFDKYRPKHWYSWQTSIWLSAVSGMFSGIADVVGGEWGIVSKFLAACGWFFLIVGISWVVKEERSTLAPWITAAVVCIFIFGSWEIGNWSLALIIWPIVSALIFALPYFWNDSLEKKIPDHGERITILLVFGTQLLLSFWIQFYLVLANFIQEYPSLYSDDLSQSLFIVRAPNRRLQEPRGVFILDLLDLEIQNAYSDRPWLEVEQELTQSTILIPDIHDLFKQVTAKLPVLKEDQHWELQDAVILPKEEQAQELVLRYDWTGSQAKEQEDYYVEKICMLQPKVDAERSPNTLLTQVDCDAATVCGWLPRPDTNPEICKPP